MQLGMVGLGKMGSNMVRRLMERGGHECVVYDINQKSVEELAAQGARGVAALEEFAAKLTRPRAIWLMLPAGEITERAIAALSKCLEPGDVLIDGGNSYYKDDVRRARDLAELGLLYMDVGTSGGVWGRERGYCLMIGGPEHAFERLESIFATLAPSGASTEGVEKTPGREPNRGTAELGYLHCGPAGAGHFVKMIHNGIEYGLMQAYAEGLDILKNADSAALPESQRYKLDLGEITELWRRGSVVGSWLLDLTAMALQESPALEEYTGFVQDSGEGRWTIQAAIEEAVPADVLTSALYVRFRSRQEHTFAEKVLSAMRKKFGGHVERPAGG